VLAEAISERGWEGHPCTDVQDAHQRVVDGGYHALFVDLVLPGSSGIKLLRHAIAYHPRRPAVLMSGSDAQHEAIIEALELGPVVFIRKPISMTDLDSALQMFREMLPGAKRMRRA
jgi:DNA-binding response OmpR family regulator